jgi:hypothetical protein
MIGPAKLSKEARRNHANGLKGVYICIGSYYKCVQSTVQYSWQEDKMEMRGGGVNEDVQHTSISPEMPRSHVQEHIFCESDWWRTLVRHVIALSAILRTQETYVECDEEV